MSAIDPARFAALAEELRTAETMHSMSQARFNTARRDLEDQHQNWVKHRNALRDYVESAAGEKWTLHTQILTTALDDAERAAARASREADRRFYRWLGERTRSNELAWEHAAASERAARQAVRDLEAAADAHSMISQS